MPIFGLRSASKAAAATAGETEEERLAREAEEERIRLIDEANAADKGSSYTGKGKRVRKKLMDEAGDY